MSVDLEAVRIEIADLLERHFRPMFAREMRLNFIAVHPNNPEAIVLVGESAPFELRAALVTLVRAHDEELWDREHPPEEP